MLNSQALSIIGTLIITFFLSFGIMLWQRRTHEQPVREQETALIAPVIARPPVSPRPLPGSHENAIVPATVSTPAVEPTVAEAPAMPVTFEIWNRRHKNKIEANVMNTSGEALSVQVSIVNQSTKQSSQLVLDLAPHGQKSFSTDDGLEMHSGDQVTLQSPPYADQGKEVP